jgi:hypothetical protein
MCFSTLHNLDIQNLYTTFYEWVRDNSIGIATRYELEGPAIESRWGAKFPTLVHPDQPWGPPSLLYSGDWVFPEGKVAGAWCWPRTSI